MTTVDAEDILRAMKALLDGENALPTADQFPKFRIGLDLALGHCWRSEWWPDLMPPVEERYFRANWLAATTYNKTTEVYDSATQAYYQCLRNSVTGAGQSPTDSAGVERSAYWARCKATYAGTHWVTAIAYAVGDIKFYPPTNRYYQCHTAHTSSATLVPDATGASERWGVLTSFKRTISKTQTGLTEIGDVFQVLDADPETNRNKAKEVAWDNHVDGIIVFPEVTRVWIQFRKPRPRLKGNYFSATLTYAAGQQVYFDNAGTQVGNFYDCVTTTTVGESPSSTAAKWSVVQIPDFFYGALVHRGVSKMLVADGQDDRAGVPAAFAEEDLGLETDVIYRQQSRTPALAVRPYR
jgi:hypothetical protein